MARTQHQERHAEMILEILSRGGWHDSQSLAEETGTADVHARLAVLRDEGWKIESRPGRTSGFFEYALTSPEKGAPRGRTQIPVRLPAHPEGRGWSEAEVERLKAKLEKHLAFLVDTLDLFESPVPERQKLPKPTAAPKIPSCIDFLLEGVV